MKKILLFSICLVTLLLVSQKAYAQCTSCTYTATASGGSFNLNGNETLCITANVSNLNINMNGTGNIICVASGVTWTQDFLTLQGGVSVDVYGTLDNSQQSWSSISVNGGTACTINVKAGGTMQTIAGGFGNNLTINNSGTLNFTATGTISHAGSFILNNAASGVVNAMSTPKFEIGNSVNVHNYGIINLSNCENAEGYLYVHNGSLLKVSREFNNHGAFIIEPTGDFQLPCETLSGAAGATVCSFRVGDKGAGKEFITNACIKVMNGNVTFDGVGTLNAGFEIGTGYNLTLNKAVTGTNGSFLVKGGTSTINISGNFIGTNMKFYDVNTAGNDFDSKFGNDPTNYTVSSLAGCVASCTAPTLVGVSADTATCTNGIANSNAAVHVTGITGMAKYAYGTNGTTGLYAANATASTASSINITGLPAPSVPTTYTFRIWASDTTCYNDTTIILNPSVCPQPSTCSACSNMISNGSFENFPNTFTFPVDFNGNPSQKIASGGAVATGWIAATDASRPIWLIKDIANTVNNPDGSYFVYAKGQYDCFQYEDFVGECEQPVAAGSYRLCFNIAAWNQTMTGSGSSMVPTTPGASQTTSQYVIDIDYTDGSQSQLGPFTIPASASWNVLNWQNACHTLTHATKTIKSVYISQDSNGPGFVLDNVKMTNSNYPYAGFDATALCSSGIASNTLNAQPSSGTWSQVSNNPVGATFSNVISATATFSATANGSYGLIWTSGTCSDTMFVTVSNCTTSCTAPTITAVAANTATCTNGIANNDAAVHVTGILDMAKYAYGTNGTTGLFAVNATASTATTIDINGLANPSVATTYTFRIWASDTTCYNDTTIILNPKTCSVPVACTTPFMATPCYVFGAYNGSTVDALVSVPAKTDSLPYVNGLDPSSIKHLATFGQIGATYGLAYKESTNILYASAYIKRHTGLGPNGTGAIYQIDPTGVNPPSLFVDLNALFGANTAGVNPHPYSPTDVCPDAGGGSTNFACWFNDVNTWNAVGREGLGDMDISEDGQFLYVMNMTNKTVYKIPTVNPTSANITTFPFPTSLPGATLVCGTVAQTPGQVRPMGLGIKNGKVYAAAICSQEVSNPNGGSIGGDKMYVYELTPSTGTWQLVLEASNQATVERTYQWPTNYKGTYADGKNMIVSDIEFDNSGGMFLGIRDISGDKYGNSAGKPIAGDGTIITYVAAGDVLKACYDAGLGKYILESDGSCGGITTAGPALGEGVPASNTTAKEYFFGDRIATDNPLHREISLGGVAYLSATNEVLVTAYDLTTVYQQGVIGLSNQTGDRTLSSVIVANSAPTSQFGKANGLGDLEIMCSAVCTPPTLTSTAVDTATCTSSLANSDAKIAVRGIAGMVKYAYSTNGTTGLYAINATASNADSIKLIGLSNPSVATTYTFRLWGVDTTCYKDTTVVLNPSVCVCTTFNVPLLTLGSISFGSGTAPLAENVTTNGSFPLSENNIVGFYVSPSSEGVFYTFCTEIAQPLLPLQNPYTHELNNSTNGFTTNQALRIAQVMQASGFNATTGFGAGNNTNANMVAMQMAIWNAFYDTDYSVSVGNFQLLTDNNNAKAICNNWLAAAQAITTPSVVVHRLHHATGQDLLMIGDVPPITAAPTAPSCTGVNAPNNGGITITGFTTGQRYQYSTGTTFNSGSAIPASITAIPTGGVIVDNLMNTTQSYTVRVYDASDDACFVDRTVSLTSVTCCTPPTLTSVAMDTATCTNGVANSNAALHVTGITGMAKYAYGTNGTTGLFANTATTSTASSINITGLPAPSVPTIYTFRIWGIDTTCYNDTTVVLTPSVCPQCSITGTFTQNTCNNNGTTSTGIDDYFTVSVSAVSATNGGASGKYEVVLNGTVLNTGGTAYGTSVTVGGTGTFAANGSTTYDLIVRDIDNPSCVSMTFTTTATQNCSVITCPTPVCIPVIVIRNN